MTVFISMNQICNQEVRNRKMQGGRGHCTVNYTGNQSFITRAGSLNNFSGEPDRGEPTFHK